MLTFGHGGNIEVGLVLRHRSRIWSAASIRIRDRVLIQHDVNVRDSDSPPQDAAGTSRVAPYVQSTRARADNVRDCLDRHQRRRVDRYFNTIV